MKINIFSLKLCKTNMDMVVKHISLLPLLFLVCLGMLLLLSLNSFKVGYGWQMPFKASMKEVNYGLIVGFYQLRILMVA